MSGFEMKFDETSSQVVAGLANLFECSKPQAVSKAIQLLAAACAKNRNDGSQLSFTRQNGDKMIIEPISGILPE